MQLPAIKIELKLRLFEIVKEVLFCDSLEVGDKLLKKEPKLGDEIWVFGVGDFVKEKILFKLFVVDFVESIIYETLLVARELRHQDIVDFASIIKAKHIKSLKNRLLFASFALWNIDILIIGYDCIFMLVGVFKKDGYFFAKIFIMAFDTHIAQSCLFATS